MRQTPNRMDDMADASLRTRYSNALGHWCSACGAQPGRWCFVNADGVWTIHGERLFAWGNLDTD